MMLSASQTIYESYESIARCGKMQFLTVTSSGYIQLPPEFKRLKSVMIGLDTSKSFANFVESKQDRQIT